MYCEIKLQAFAFLLSFIPHYNQQKGLAKQHITTNKKVTITDQFTESTRIDANVQCGFYHSVSQLASIECDTYPLRMTLFCTGIALNLTREEYSGRNSAVKVSTPESNEAQYLSNSNAGSFRGKLLLIPQCSYDKLTFLARKHTKHSRRYFAKPSTGWF